jgi:hypothetical protein
MLSFHLDPLTALLLQPGLSSLGKSVPLLSPIEAKSVSVERENR